MFVTCSVMLLFIAILVLSNYFPLRANIFVLAVQVDNMLRQFYIIYIIVFGGNVLMQS
jgi:hypothetical protein